MSVRTIVRSSLTHLANRFLRDSLHCGCYAVRMFDAREYDRLSKDKGGTSIARQRDENRSARAERGWTAGAPYSDDDRSASPYRRKSREDYDRLLEDLETGRFGAKILQAYETSRLTRETEQTVRLIKVCRAADVKIFITQEDRLYNLENARDRKHLKDAANDDEYSSDQTSKRVGDTAVYEAEQGRPYGKAPYGYKPLYDERKGNLINWHPDEDTLAGYVMVHSRAHVVRTLFARLEEGHSLKRIHREFKACGYLNASGKPFSDQHLRNIAVRPVYAGIRHYKGQDFAGIWDGLVPEERFRVVQRMLSDPSRRTTRGGRAVHEFTGILACERCGGLTHVKKTHGSGTLVYQCRKWHVSMLKDDVDRILTDELIKYLSRDDVYSALTARSGNEADVAAVRTALANARLEKQAMDAETPETLAEVRVLARATHAVEKRITKLEEQEREMTLPPALASLLGAKGSIKDAWFKAPVEACREIVRHVMVPELLGKPFITSVPVGQWRTPANERLQWDID